jgi:hypothetical protein
MVYLSATASQKKSSELEFSFAKTINCTAVDHLRWEIRCALWNTSSHDFRTSLSIDFERIGY